MITGLVYYKCVKENEKKRLIKKEKIIHNLISSKEEIANNVEMMGAKKKIVTVFAIPTAKNIH